MNSQDKSFLKTKYGSQMISIAKVYLNNLVKQIKPFVDSSNYHYSKKKKTSHQENECKHVKPSSNVVRGCIFKKQNLKI